MTAIETAINLANKSPMSCKFGAVLIYRGNIIGSGFNKYIGNGDTLGYKKNGVFERYLHCIHAEVACLISCKQKNYIKDATMILVKLKNKDETQKCDSCISCKKFIEKYGVRRVVYSY